MGVDVSILELAHMIGSVVGWEGEYVFDANMPDGVMRKLMDVSRLTDLGWEASIPLERGIEMTYPTPAVALAGSRPAGTASATGWRTATTAIR